MSFSAIERKVTTTAWKLASPLQSHLLDSRGQRGRLNTKQRGRAVLAIHLPLGLAEGGEDVLALLSFLFCLGNHTHQR